MATANRIFKGEFSPVPSRWSALRSAVRRWDVALGSGYSRTVTRPFFRTLGRALAALVLAVLLVAKWQAVTQILGGNARGASEFDRLVVLLNYILQLPFLALAVFLVIFRKRHINGVARCSGILAGIGGTLFPSILFYDSNATVHDSLIPISIVFLVGGMIWAILSLAVLGRCFGVMPEARGLVTQGPYRWMRHPVYLGEITATLGILLPILSVFHVVVFAVFVALQLWRTREEEAVLASTFDQYQDYRLRTRRLIPGVW